MSRSGSDHGNSEFGDALAAIRGRCGDRPFDLAVILGSGLGRVAEEAENTAVFDYRELAGLPATTVPGHAGRLTAGDFGGWRTLFFAGRYHLYEGYSARQASAPVRLAHALGVPRLLLTNAVGGIRPEFAAGDFMYILDHINLLGDNPLRGEREHPFIDLSALYRQDLLDPLRRALSGGPVRLHSGVLAALPGPSYETPAEIRMLRTLGADAVSMSTVSEAIMGKYLKMEIAGLSLVSNPAAGIASAPLDHRDVLETGRRREADFRTLMRTLAEIWQQGSGSAAPRPLPRN